MSSACTVRAPCSQCPLRLSDFSSPAWYRLSVGLHDANAIQVFENISHLRVCTTHAILTQPFALSQWGSTPAIPGIHTSVHRRGGYLVRPHHLPRMLGFQEPAGVLLRDPNSLICFNSPLKAQSPRRKKYFFSCIYSEHVVTIAFSYFFGANKKLLIRKSCKMLAVL